jgi:hypothetical protein
VQEILYGYELLKPMFKRKKEITGDVYEKVIEARNILETAYKKLRQCDSSEFVDLQYGKDVVLLIQDIDERLSRLEADIKNS